MAPGSHKLRVKILGKLALGQLLFQLQFLGMGFVIKDTSLQLNHITVKQAADERWSEATLLLN